MRAPISHSTISGWHVIVDTALVYEFCGNHLADVRRNGQLRDHDDNRLLENVARTKVSMYRDAYANRPGTTYAFPQCAMSTMSTSGQNGHRRCRRRRHPHYRPNHLPNHPHHRNWTHCVNCPDAGSVLRTAVL